MFKKSHVSRVAPRPSALNVIDTKLIELLRNPEFGCDRERYALGLRTIPKGSIVNQNIILSHIYKKIDARL